MTEKWIIITALMGTAALTLLLAMIAWRKRTTGLPAICLSICLTGVAVYSFGYGMEIFSSTLRTAMFWVRFQHWGIQVIAPAWLLFAMAVSGKEQLITKKLIIALSIIPIYLFLHAQTLGWLNLAHHNPQLVTSGTISVIAYDRNLFNYIAIGYYSVCLTISTILFMIMLYRSAPSFRKQAVIYLIGAMPPWIGAVLHNLSILPSSVDFTPLAMGIGGLIFSFGFLRYGVLDIIPVARDAIFENMSVGVLILDREDRVIDFNPALMGIFNEICSSAVGSSVFDIFTNQPTLLELMKDENPRRTALQVDEGRVASFYNVSLSPMFDRHQRPIGKLISFYEYTKEKRLIDELEKRAALDGLTGIYNRQYFDQLVTKEMSRCQRYGGNLSLVMLDLDGFKRINDMFGHAAGDLALISTAKTLRDNLRLSDILARFGGEEFLILLPQTGLPAAIILSERLKLALETQEIQYKENSFTVKASFGVTSMNAGDKLSAETFYRQADIAMYSAKESGGNRVTIFDTSIAEEKQLASLAKQG